MRTLSIKVGLSACLLAMWLPLVSEAQTPAEGTVTGTGSVEISRPAEFLRVQVEVLVRGKDLKEALAKLKERKEASQAQLKTLGAGKDDVHFGEAVVSSDKTPQQMQVERMFGEQRGSRAKKTPAKAPANPPVLVAALLVVDLPLKGASKDDLLIVSQELRDKIKAADLSGMKELEKMTPQEEELAEELEGLRGRYGDDGPKRGEPSFQFVAKIAEEERDKALAEAFQKAKKDAGRLARAAGMDLGPLHQLASNHSPSSFNGDDGRYPPGRYHPIAGSYDAPPPSTRDWNGEVVGMYPGAVSVRIAVTTTFTLKTVAGK